MDNNFTDLNQKIFSFNIQPQLEFKPFYKNNNKEIVELKRKDQFLPNSETDLSPLEKTIITDKENKKDITYKINQYGHRCDNFLNIHNGLHVLFSGCSITFGEGLPLDRTWAYYLYKKIKKENSLSGYYNLSYTGGGIDTIINNLFRYCGQFKNPDIIFILMPNIEREYAWWYDKYYLTSPQKNNVSFCQMFTVIL